MRLSQSRVLSSMNISIALPLEFVKFRHHEFLDLSHNYFNGTVPSRTANAMKK
ncbi:putative leucine-rich repeat domain superfamily [Helianthus debilis subsp. tardiflorus]